ncbi:MAG: hypothetical protein IJZ16_04535 [Clostridia bacterium]|nr:hypothetical protein [Clostridia bacterium]
MIKFDGLVIKVEPDYKDRIEKGIEIDELWCEVYQESDTEFKHKLGDFNMMQNFEYDDESVESIEKGIKQMVERDWSSYQLEIKILELDRMKQILGNAVEYIKESVNSEDLNHVLKICIGMTDDEISSLNEDVAEEQNQGMNLS